MYLKIESDIIDKALDKRDEISIDVLRQAALATRNGKHIVVIKNSDVIKLLSNKELFSKYELSSFDKIGKMYTQISSLEEKMEVKVLITYSQCTKKTSNIIYINPNETRSFEFFEETHLLTENLDDAFFFENLVKYYQRKERIKRCSSCSYNLMGGGNTTADVIEYEKKLKQHFVFSVIDSDFHFQGDTHLGDTAKKTQDRLKDNPFNCSFYVMNKVCEVENLIPHECLYKNSNFKNHRIIKNPHKFDMSFFDMKDGVHIQYLYSDDGFNYWSKELNNHILANKFNPINKDRKKKTKEQFKQIYKEKVLIEGFGSQILSESLKILPQILPIVEAEHLTPSQEHEWTEIGKRIFNWCCCYSKQYT